MASEGFKARVQVDNELVRGLLFANGGGAVALLAFLPTAFDRHLVLPVVWALFIFHLGIVAAIVHNNYRRECSLEYERHDYRPPSGSLWGFDLKMPTVCFISRCFRWTSIALFLLGGFVVFMGTLLATK